MLLSDNGTIIVDPYGPNPQDRHLIAAAPELLEALHACLSHIAGELGSPSLTEMRRKARAAIAKAEGRS